MRLENKRYDEIEQKVLQFLQSICIYTFPMDVFDICKQLNIKLIPYSACSQKKQEALHMGSEDGFYAVIELQKNVYEYRIYYNDSMPSQRIRFTIMHEIGHIILDHTEHSDLAESEANYFAKYALAPPPLIHLLKIEDYVQLAEVFDLSRQCAYYAMNKYSKWLRYGSKEILEHEYALVTLFQNILQ